MGKASTCPTFWWKPNELRRRACRAAERRTGVLRSRDGFDLDNVAKTANRALKALSEESFVSTERTPAHVRTEATLEIVKHVISVKLAEEASAKRRAENRAERERLLRILAEKQEGQLSALTEKELQERLKTLEP